MFSYRRWCLIGTDGDIAVAQFFVGWGRKISGVAVGIVSHAKRTCKY